MNQRFKYTVWDDLQSSDFDINQLKKNLFEAAGRWLATAGDDLLVNIQFHTVRHQPDSSERNEWEWVTGAHTVYIVDVEVLEGEWQKSKR